MDITPATVVWMIVILVVGLACWAFEAVCRRADAAIDRELEAAGVRRYEPRHDARQPRRAPDWSNIERIIDQDRERIATTGELRALYARPYPGATDTGELRALAEQGDTDTINAIVDAWKADNLDDDEAAA